jgi:hypothetical protein
VLTIGPTGAWSLLPAYLLSGHHYLPGSGRLLESAPWLVCQETGLKVGRVADAVCSQVCISPED